MQFLTVFVETYKQCNIKQVKKPTRALMRELKTAHKCPPPRGFPRFKALNGAKIKAPENFREPDAVSRSMSENYDAAGVERWLSLTVSMTRTITAPRQRLMAVSTMKLRPTIPKIRNA